jgi:hypothetical protein
MTPRQAEALLVAARKVVAGHAARLRALEPGPIDPNAFQDAINSRDDAIEDIASVLLTIDGEEAPCPG